MLQKQDALLKDEPTFSHWEPPAGQILITTAMAVSGKQKGTIYGSVQWGWQVDVKGNFVKLPLTVKSFGEPSQAFIAAAGQWNEHQHFFKSKKNPLLMLELPQILYTNRSGAYLVGSPVNWKKSIIVTLPAHTKVQGTAVKGNWYRVTVVDGKFAGQVGWIMFNLLSEKKV